MKKYINAVEKNKSLILESHKYFWSNPETGYKEYKTSEYLEDAFEKLGYKLTKAENITGFFTVLDTGKPGPEVLVLGELDALLCAEHPESDPETGAVHCCGHSAQCAALLGVAAALKEPGILDDLCGRIRLCAVPAEELIEIDYRLSLKEKGIINYLEGKSEFLSRGYFDGVDLAFMVHSSQGDSFTCRKGSVGAVAKEIIYKGVSAHAGGSPWNGCNALYAANLGLSAINSIRETFKEPDLIRVHPIIKQGGTAVNAIPDKVVLESYVRGSTFEAIKDANQRVNRAMCGGALSIGANIEIRDIFAFSPLTNSEKMIEVVKEAASGIPGTQFLMYDVIGSGSTDMGDLSVLMPVVHPYAPGASGTSHGSDYQIKDPDLACVGSAKLQINMLYILLKDNAKTAKQIVSDFKPLFKCKDEYFEYVSSFNKTVGPIGYSDNGKIEIQL
ncbi:MAG: amidohydrolase [Clostridia bacterium]|nr:amidohydrolase [Clostridia bacterium]MBR4723529.1 amidohydrolase [Clostridia bacterium]